MQYRCSSLHSRWMFLMKSFFSIRYMSDQFFYTVWWGRFAWVSNISLTAKYFPPQKSMWKIFWNILLHVSSQFLDQIWRFQLNQGAMVMSSRLTTTLHQTFPLGTLKKVMISKSTFQSWGENLYYALQKKKRFAATRTWGWCSTGTRIRAFLGYAPLHCEHLRPQHLRASQNASFLRRTKYKPRTDPDLTQMFSARSFICGPYIFLKNICVRDKIVVYLNLASAVKTVVMCHDYRIQGFISS